jgi:hypothetical protein
MVNRSNLEQSGTRRPWQFMERFTIKMPDGSIYLDRLRIIQTPFFGIMLHKFTGPDAEPYLHDHPWSFFSIVLRGGYREMRRNNHTYTADPKRVRFFNFMSKHDAHFIYQLDRNPTWTLVIHGRRRRTWGFYIPTTHPPDQTWIEFQNMDEYKASHLKQRF